ncbi:MAG TPA: hypothetical protein VLL48_02270 [Longimicrobiales bacterium]|nr:hypothetical protein [Longimicrobiales bacterium]
MSRACVYATTLLIALAPLSACSDGPTGPTGDELTEEESAALMEAFASLSAFAAPPTQPDQQASMAPASMAAQAITLEFTFDEDHPCPQGGQANLSGSVNGEFDSETGEGTFGFSYSLDPDGCVVVHAPTERTFTLTGAPDVDVTMDLTITQTAVTASGGHEGRIAWESEGESGECPIDVTFDFSGEETALSGTVSGSVCGYSVERTINIAEVSGTV